MSKRRFHVFEIFQSIYRAMKTLIMLNLCHTFYCKLKFNDYIAFSHIRSPMSGTNI